MTINTKNVPLTAMAAVLTVSREDALQASLSLLSVDGVTNKLRDTKRNSGSMVAGFLFQQLTRDAWGETELSDFRDAAYAEAENRNIHVNKKSNSLSVQISNASAVLRHFGNATLARRFRSLGEAKRAMQSEKDAAKAPGEGETATEITADIIIGLIAKLSRDDVLTVALHCEQLLGMPEAPETDADQASEASQAVAA